MAAGRGGLTVQACLAQVASLDLAGTQISTFRTGTALMNWMIGSGKATARRVGRR